jgi:anti-anti-sigma regulatory factor
MLRITENSENGKTVKLRVEGTITSDSYPDLEDIFSRVHSTDGKTIIFDMAGVVFMHVEVAQKLAKLASEGLKIINCSPFIATLLLSIEKQDGRS